MGFADKDGVVLDQSPSGAPLEFTVTANGQPVGAAVTVPPHADGIPKTYFPLVFTPPQPGVYTVTTSVNGTPLESPIQISDSTSVLAVGKPMIPFDTPTTTDQRGVQLLCTRQPQCPLHDVTLRDALAGGTPVAFLIATPQFCQQAICGPVLDVLLGQKDAFPGVKMLHSEVYPTVEAAQPNTLQVTDVVMAYGLTFEPALYLAGAGRHHRQPARHDLRQRGAPRRAHRPDRLRISMAGNAASGDFGPDLSRALDQPMRTAAHSDRDRRTTTDCPW